MSSQGTANEVLLESAFRMSTALETKKLCEVRYYPKIKKKQNNNNNRKTEFKTKPYFEFIKNNELFSHSKSGRNSHRADDRGHE